MSMTAQFGWVLRQFDIIGAYLLAVPTHAYYVSFPSGFDEYLRSKHDALPFAPSEYLLRVSKNCYAAPDTGRVWYGAIAGYLLSLIPRHSPTDR